MDINMTLGEFLTVVDKDTFLVVSVPVCGMQFQTRHCAESFVKNGGDLNSRKILKVYNMDGDICVRLVG